MEAVYFVLLFLGSASLDVLNTNWTNAVVNENAFRASLCTFIYYIISTTLIIACCNSLWAIVPAALGHAAGTYIAVKWNVCLVRVERKADFDPQTAA